MTLRGRWRALATAALVAVGVGGARAREPAAIPAPIPEAAAQTVAALQAKALKSDLAYTLVEELTTQVGPRPAGSEAEARARAWAVGAMKRLGFVNVHVETFTVPYWKRLAESAEIVSPSPQRLAVVALGGSAPTPAGGLIAEVVRFPSLSALRAAPNAAVAGKIVFIDERMGRTQDGSGYGAVMAKRRQGPAVAGEKGAVALLIRTLGTSDRRLPNTGNIRTGQTRSAVPAAALSNPDSDQLARLAAKGAVRLRLDIQAEVIEDAPSGNVIGEIRGREKPDEIVLIGGHLDSWDLSPAAQDDGAGIGLTMAAARLIAELPKHPKRTIRVVLFGAEEIGDLGALAYVEAHKGEFPAHAMAAEADFGAGRAWRADTGFGPGTAAEAAAMAQALAPLGIIPGRSDGRSGSDVGEFRPYGVPLMGLVQDGEHYFDIHHTADDTLDKIDKDELAQNVAGFATLTYLAAEMGWNLRGK